MGVLIAPMQWADVDDIEDVEPISDSDTECLSEIRDVLRKYGNLNRFGVALLHSHFEVSEDEILLETTDKDGRTLLTRPVKADGSGDNNIGTIFQLTEGDPATMAWCKSYCYRTSFGNHTEHHRRVKD